MDAGSKYHIEHQKKWDRIEKLVMDYQKQFEDGCTPEQKAKSQESASKIIEKFDPLLGKYLNLLTGRFINFYDKDMKEFVYLFINNKNLRKVLRSKHIPTELRHTINNKFNFIRTTYGQLNDDDIMTDLQFILLTLAKRYKQSGRTFCVYVSSVFKFELARHIKKFIKDPINLPYKNMEFLDTIKSEHNEDPIEMSYEDTYNENDLGLPNLQWMHGNDCSEEFECLSNMERMVLVKYYLEGWHDKMIADRVGVSVSTLNKIRRDAAEKVAEKLGYDKDDIVRRRMVNTKNKI